jgi:hypothetical protein
MNDFDENPNRPKSWGPGRRCEECGNPTWECACVEDNLSED